MLKSVIAEKRGFTLIELIMLIVIVGIALVPIINMFMQGIKGSAESKVTNIAHELAREKMEETKQIGFGRVSNSSGTFPSPFEAYSYQITVGYVDDNFATSGSPTQYKKVEVRVTHSSGTGLSLTTVMANHS